MRAVKGALTMPRLSHLRVVTIAARIEGSMQGSHMKSLRMMKRPARDERYHEDRYCVEFVNDSSAEASGTRSALQEANRSSKRKFPPKRRSVNAAGCEGSCEDTFE